MQNIFGQESFFFAQTPVFLFSKKKMTRLIKAKENTWRFIGSFFFLQLSVD